MTNPSTRRTGRPLYGLIYAGGAGTRLGGVDKARLRIAADTGRDPDEHPWLVARVAAALRPQVDRVVIARSAPDDTLLAFGDVVVDVAPPDGATETLHAHSRPKPRQGPLGGLIAAMRRWPEADWLTVPVDCPTVPHDLATRLNPRATPGQRPRYLHDGERSQPLHAYWPSIARAGLESLWRESERSLIRVLRALDAETVPAADLAPSLHNLNVPADLERAGVDPTAPRPTPPRLWIAITAPSGTGKTTLLTHVLKHLRNQGLPPGAVVKHSHHRIAFDPPHKDSARLLGAGGLPTLLVTPAAARLVAPLAYDVASSARLDDGTHTGPEDRDTQDGNRDVLAVASRWLPRQIKWILVEGCAHCQHPTLERVRLWRTAPSSDPTTPTSLLDLASTVALSRDDAAVGAWAVPRAHHDELRALLAATQVDALTRPAILDLDDPAAVAGWIATRIRRRLISGDSS